MAETDDNRARISWFDMLIYRLFYWRWMPLLKSDPQLLGLFQQWMNGWIAQEGRSTTNDH